MATLVAVSHGDRFFAGVTSFVRLALEVVSGDAVDGVPGARLQWGSATARADPHRRPYPSSGRIGRVADSDAAIGCREAGTATFRGTARLRGVR